MIAPRLTLSVAGRAVPWFQVCGVVGFACACAVAFGLTRAQDRSLAAQAAVIALAVLVFFSLALITKHVLGRETLIYYHHEIAVLGSVAALAAVVAEPVTAVLDATALGLGAFLACGRVGCAMAGCCHGRPSRWGLRYPAEYADLGPPAYLIGVRLFPVQLVEAAGVALLVAAGVRLVLNGAAAGTAFGLYVAGHAVLRFAVETRRGDLERPYLLGVSAAQWTSLTLCVVVYVLGAAGALPAAWWHLAAAAVLAVSAALLVVRRTAGTRDLLAPLHVREVAAVLARLPETDGGPVATVRTSTGLRLSHGVTGGAEHVSLSRDGEPLTQVEAAQLARLVAWLEAPRAPVALVPGAADVVHVVLPRG